MLAGSLAYFFPKIAEHIWPPPVRYGKVDQFQLKERMTLKNYLAYMDKSGMANSIADGHHSEAEKRQIGMHVQFRVEVAGYVRHRCEIDYDVLSGTGSAIVPTQSLIPFSPEAEKDGGTFDVWVPRVDNEKLDVTIFDDSPRPPGHILAAQPQTIDWK